MRDEKIVWREDKTELKQFDNGDALVIETTKFMLYPSKTDVTTIVTLNPLALDRLLNVLGVVVDTVVRFGK